MTKPQTLEEIREAVRKETDPLKKYQLGLQARKLRGHGETLFASQAQSPDAAEPQSINPELTLDQVRLLMDSVDDSTEEGRSRKYALAARARELRGHANLLKT